MVMIAVVGGMEVVNVSVSLKFKGSHGLVVDYVCDCL